MSAQSKHQLSEATYLAQESTAPEKSEFLNGEIFAMAGVSRAHSQITSNLVVAIGSELLDKSFSDPPPPKVDRLRSEVSFSRSLKCYQTLVVISSM